MTPATVPEVDLSTVEARRMFLHAQGLMGTSVRRGGMANLLHRLSAVQLDTISVLARSHELVPYARLGPIGRGAVEAAYWSEEPESATPAFEYWAHAACILPIEQWPLLSFRRREMRRRGRRWHQVSEEACRKVLARLRAEGPLSATELGGAKGGGPWWDWSEVKVAVEWLLDIGEVVCVRRASWRRVYDLPERAIPSYLLDQDPPDKQCLTQLVRRAGAALGVGTRADLADYYRLTGEQVDSVVAETGLVPVRVSGWSSTQAATRVRDGNSTRSNGDKRAGHAGRDIAWADPDVLAGPIRGRHRTTLLSPFDSLVWDRARTLRVFGFHHRLEAYVPRHKRVHGYFAMPLLAGGKLVGRVDPGRDGPTLVAKQVSMERPSAVEPMAAALREAAEWVGCDNVRVERVDPPDLAAALHDSLP